MRRRLLVLAAALLVPCTAPPVTAAATAKPTAANRTAANRTAADPTAGAAYPRRIELPRGFRPEGVQAGTGTTIYAGSLADGSIWRGDVRTGRGAIWVRGRGAPALGLTYDAQRNLLWVAGGPSGEVRAYDVRTARRVRTYTFPGSGFLNDLVVTRAGVYVTDSFVRRLAVIPFRANGALPAAGHTMRLTGDIHYIKGDPRNPAFNANGIVASGGYLVIDQSVTGQLFRVSAHTGAARAIKTPGSELSDADGLELKGRKLYVVRNLPNQVDRLVLDVAGLRTRPAGELVGNLDIPSAATFVGTSLYVVNARFYTTPTARTSYWISRVR